MAFLQADDCTLINLDHVSTIVRKGTTLIFNFNKNNEKVRVVFDSDHDNVDCRNAFDGLKETLNVLEFQTTKSTIESELIQTDNKNEN